MKSKIIITVFLLDFVLESCISVSTSIPAEMDVPMTTPTPISLAITQTPNSSTTGAANYYPPCAPPYPYNEYSHLVSTPILQLKISNGLTLKEYKGRPDIKEEESGCRYEVRDRVRMPAITLNNSFHIIDEPIEDLREKIFVFSNDEKVFETQISQYVYSGLLEAWEYDNHWVIEFVTTDSDAIRNGIPPKIDIIDIVRDGVSLKKENDYQAVFSFNQIVKVSDNH